MNHSNVVLVTNVGQGFGRAIALSYGTDGYNVVCADKDVDLSVLFGCKNLQLEGKISFVSDEVDPVNQQVRVWAEIDNSRLELRPGDRGRLSIENRQGR